MKKNLLLVVVCTLFVTSAYAQERGFGYGIKAGVNIAKVTNMGVDSKVGFTGGIFVDYRFSKVFALSADILYSGQGGILLPTEQGFDASLAQHHLVA